MSNQKSQNSSEWDVPEYSRSQVKRAGKKLIDRECSEEERLKSNKILSNWRASHAYTTNQLYNILKEKSLGVNNSSIVVQRLKRMPSITGKLERFQQMGLDRMQDVGGVRTVLKSTEEVYDVRDAMIHSNIEHILHKEDDYIQNPKGTGYRGIHLVYKYSPTEDENKSYSNLLTELQIRSEIQHSWATAVEIIDIITKQSLKTTQEQSDWSEFFALVGDEFAVLEGQPTRDTKLSPEHRKGQIRSLERKLGVLNKLGKLTVLPLIMDNVPVSGEYFLLRLDLGRKPKEIKVTRYGPRQVRKAHERYDELERQYKETSSVDVLLVSSDSLDALKTAYPNYFTDANKFIDYLNQRLGGNYHKLTELEFAPSFSEDYNKVVELNPNSANTYNNRGIDKFHLGQYAGAIKDYDKAIELKPDYAWAYNNRGNAKCHLGQYVEGIEDFNKAIELNPDNAEAYSNRGSAKLNLDQYPGAIKDYDKAIELKPDYAGIYDNRGNAKFSLGQYLEAVEDYSKAIELSPDYAGAYNNRGCAKGNLGQYVEAIKDYDKAIELSPDYAKACYNRGFAKGNLGQYAEAIKDYDKAIELSPDYAGAYHSRGFAKLNLGQHTEAIEDYNKAIELEPDYATAYSSRGLAKSNLGQHTEAIEDYDKAIELNPDYAGAYHSRGFAKLNLGQHTEAIEDYNKAIELEPDYAAAYSSRGLAKSNLGQHTEAIEDCSKAIELNSDYAYAYSNRGGVKFGFGQHTEAIEDYNKAIELEPDYAAAYYNRGNVNRAIRENEKAIEDFKKALHLAQEQGDTQLAQTIQDILTELKT